MKYQALWKVWAEVHKYQFESLGIIPIEHFKINKKWWTPSFIIIQRLCNKFGLDKGTTTIGDILNSRYERSNLLAFLVKNKSFFSWQKSYFDNRLMSVCLFKKCSSLICYISWMNNYKKWVKSHAYICLIRKAKTNGTISSSFFCWRSSACVRCWTQSHTIQFIDLVPQISKKSCHVKINKQLEGGQKVLFVQQI